MRPADMRAIIETLDAELEKCGKSFLTPPAANRILQACGLLCDSESKPGQNLRLLLQKGKIPHAYKVAGKKSQWVIPHSSARRTLDKPTADYSKEQGSAPA